jgi:hypothetical protein
MSDIDFAWFVCNRKKQNIHTKWHPGRTIRTKLQEALPQIKYSQSFVTPPEAEIRLQPGCSRSHLDGSNTTTSHQDRARFACKVSPVLLRVKPALPTIIGDIRPA